MKRFAAAALTCALALAVFSGCTQPPATASKAASGTKPASGVTSGKALYAGTKEAGTITVNLGSEPAELNSNQVTDSPSMTILRHVQEGLVALDAKNAPVPGMATKWEFDEKTQTYTFHLRDAKWSNGDPVTANDFVFAFRSLVDPAKAAEYSYFGYILKNGEAINKKEKPLSELGVKAVDEKTLTVTLEQPTAYALDMLAFGSFLPINEKFYAAQGENYGADVSKLIYNGPYKMTKWENENQIILEKNPEYWGAADVSINKIVFKMIKDTNTAMNEFKAGNLDMIGLTGEQVNMLKGEGQKTYGYDDGSSWYFEFNTTFKGLTSAKIRKAMTIGVDVQSFITNVLKNNSAVATNLTPPTVGIAGKPGVKFVDTIPADIKIKRDVDAAKKLLEEGLKESGLTAETFKPVMICDDTDNAQKYAAYFQEQWRKNLGLSVEVRPMPFKSRIAAMQSKQFEIVFAGWSLDYNDPNTFLDLFVSGGGNNHTSYKNPAYDKLVADAAKEADADKRAAKFIELEKILLTDYPIGPVYWRMRDYTTSAKLTGVVRTAFQDMNFRWAKIA